MKILKEGRDLTWRQEENCNSCDATLEVEQEDLFWDYDNVGLTTDRASVAFRCPCCGRLNHIDRPKCSILEEESEESLARKS